MSSSRGFTLIELLVVIAIIGLLSSIVLVSLNTARAKGLDAQRVANLRSIQTALELYYNSHNAYPTTNSWNSQCSAWGHVANPNDVIPGLVADGDIANLPSDPQMNTSANTCCYLYTSNGADYKLLFHACPSSLVCYGSGEASGPLPDPTRPSWACAVWSSSASQGW